MSLYTQVCVWDPGQSGHRWPEYMGRTNITWSIAVQLSPLSAWLPSFSVDTSFWSKTRFFHFCSRGFTADSRNNSFFFLIENPTNETLQYIPAQSRQAEELAHNGPTRLGLKDTFPWATASSVQPKPKLQPELMTIVTELRVQPPRLGCSHKWVHPVHAQVTSDWDSPH